jgi:hypothetical protein
MELVATLFSATAAAAPAAATAAGASSALSILQGVATAGSALLSIASGNSQARQEEGIRRQAEFETGLAETSGEMRANAARMKGYGQAFGTGAGGLIDIARRG